MKSRVSRGRSFSALAVALSALAAASCSSENGSSDNNASNGSGPTGDVTTGGTAATTTGAGPVTTGNSGAVTTTGAGPTTGGPTTGAATTTGGVGGAGAGNTTTGGVASTGDTTGVQTTSTTGTGGTGGNGEWWFDGPREPPPLGTWPPPALKLTEVAAGTQPTAIAAPRADNTRLYFTEKWGAIRLIKDGVLVAEPALDLSADVLEGGPQGATNGEELEHQGKRGLVGLAFDPYYEDNGRVFVMYTADQGVPGYGTNDHNNVYDDGDMTIAEYRRSADNPDKFDPASKKVIVQWDKGDCDQCSQHNGGSLEIDVDGYLWASSGDPPPYENAGSADPNNLNGKLLKFDISGEEVVGAGNYPGGDPMVQSIGIRNAYKFSVDRYTGELYIGDVGENLWEEVTVQAWDAGNKNHGFPAREGKHRLMGDCTGDNCLEPVFDYEHSGSEGDPGADNCIIGGYVYRGTAIPALQGAYLYGDYGSSKLRVLQIEGGVLKQADPHDTGLSVFMGCFGEDAAGELYVCDYNNNKILRIDAQ